MKNSILLVCFLFSTYYYAQDFEDKEDSQTEEETNDNAVVQKNTASFELGKGLQFSLEDNKYQFNIGGFIQPVYQYTKYEDAKAENKLNLRRTYFSISGKAVREKVGFLVQADFSLNQPLLDAYISYHPSSKIEIIAGQKRTPLNNKEMTIDENRFQFTERSLLSTTLTNTGREFGLFANGNFSFGNMGFVPQLAVTSGDGRNSFGTDSRDGDNGGLKFGARLDLYPLGFFKEGNQHSTADLLHEDQLKVALGVAGSMNKGASNAVGEGHGDFLLYGEESRTQYPDYRKFYNDILIKYKGFSLLWENVMTSATNLDGIYTNEAATTLLYPQQISSYLMLGDAYNIQLGYVTLKGFAIDLRYTQLNPEFKNYESSLLQDVKAYSVGLTKYFKGNDLKIQTSVTQLEHPFQKGLQAELLLQVVF